MVDADPITAESHRFSTRLPRPLWFLLATVVVLVVPVGLRIGMPGFIRHAAILIVLGVMSAVLIRVQIHRQQTAIRGVKRLGGTVATSSFVSNWLTSIVGAAWSQVVVRVDLNGSMFADADLARLKALASLEHINLDSTQVTDAGLAGLTGLTSLRILGLNNTQVTAVGLVHLEGLLNLQVLSLADTPVTDEGLVHLEGLFNLQWLSVANTPVSDAGLVNLEALTGLQWLWLDGTPVTDAGIAELKRALPDLKVER